MDNLSEFMQLCRLCLVKDQVNVPIFEEQGDIRQIFLKITACLPIKVSKDDSLPKKICDGCLYKLELLYQFWNTTANAEKQLLAWLSQAGMEADSKTTQEAVAIALQTQVTTHSVKEEEIDPPESIPESTDDMTTEAESFIMQPPQLPFEPAGAQFDEPSGFNESQGESHDDDDNGAQNDDDSEDEETEPPPRKRSRRQAAIKAAQLVAQKDDDDDDEDEEEDVDDPDDPTVEEPTIPKTEEESEEEMEESGTNPEPTDFVSLGTADEEQPGPSGVGKVDNSEAPSLSTKKYKAVCKDSVKFELKKLIGNIKPKNILISTGSLFRCYTCKQGFSDAQSFLKHRQSNCTAAQKLDKSEETKKISESNKSSQDVRSSSSSSIFQEVSSTDLQLPRNFTCFRCLLDFSNLEHFDNHMSSCTFANDSFIEFDDKPKQSVFPAITTPSENISSKKAVITKSKKDMAKIDVKKLFGGNKPIEILRVSPVVFRCHCCCANFNDARSYVQHKRIHVDHLTDEQINKDILEQTYKLQDHANSIEGSQCSFTSTAASLTDTLKQNKKFDEKTSDMKSVNVA